MGGRHRAGPELLGGIGGRRCAPRVKNGAASPGAQAAAAEFLQRVERSRSNFEPDTTPLTPLQEKLVELIEQAFAGVQCLNEPYVLLCGEALQSQVKMKEHGHAPAFALCPRGLCFAHLGRRFAPGGAVAGLACAGVGIALAKISVMSKRA